MSVAAIGILGFKSPFWGVPSGFLSGPAAAAAIASINSIGNLGGFAGPFLLGAVRQTSGDYRVGLYVLAVGLLVSAFAVRGPARRPRQSFLAR
jgi:ACS family tartrate transporter-like MFS transporter